MRSKSGMTVFAWIMLAAIIFGLGGYGVTNFGGGVASVGKVGSQEISTRDYYRAMQSELDAYRAQYGQDKTVQQAMQAGVGAQVQQRLVITAALDNADANLGLSIGNRALRKAISAMSAFRGPDGKFDDQAYGSVLRSNGLTKSGFEKNMRKQLARDILQQAFAGAVPASPTYVDSIAAYIAERRGFSLLKITAADLKTPVPAPTDKELHAYYGAHKKAFTAPEAKMLTYAALTPEMMAKKIPIDDKTLRALYDKNKASYVTPETRKLDRLVYPDAAAAKAAKAALDAGSKTFAQLVTDRGLKLSDIAMGAVTRDQLSKAAGAAVFAAQDQSVVGPVDSSLGPALFRIDGITAAKTTSFAEAKAGLAKGLQDKKATEMISTQVEKISDKLAGGATLEDLAKETDMELGRMAFSQGDSAGLAAYPAFRAAAQKVQDGDYPSLIQLKDGGIAALRLDKTRKAALIPYDKVAGKVKAAWTAEATTKALKAQAEDIVKAVKGGADLAGFGKLEANQPILRSGYVDGAPSALVPDIFALKAVGDLTSVEAGDAAWVVRLDKIVPADPKDPDVEKLKARLAATAAQGIESDGFNMFATALMSKTKVSLDQAAIAAVNAQFH
jgi:peptidyl-prolyl cis-trans isomerase D